MTGQRVHDDLHDKVQQLHQPIYVMPVGLHDLQGFFVTSAGKFGADYAVYEGAFCLQERLAAD